MPTSASCDSIGDALDFFEGISGRQVHEATLVDFYASHEGLHLLYEQAQTRFIPRQNRWYNLSTHMPWIGMRTAALDGAHVEYFRGISNPIGVKIGSAMDAAWLQGLVTTLNPQNQPGRLTFIHRFGAKDIAAALPKAIEAVRQTGQTVLWVCDPMHGNTETTTGGLKTRRFENILKELDLAFRIHADMGSYLGGVHIELTGDDVTECTGGARGLTDQDLQRAYRSSVDPRLNHEQALELAMLIAERSQSRRADGAAASLPRPRARRPCSTSTSPCRRQGGTIRINARPLPRACPIEPIIPFIEGDGIGIDVTPAMQRVVDAAVAEGLRRAGAASPGWRSTAGEKANALLRPVVPGRDAARAARVRGLDQGAARHPGRRRHALAERGHAPEPRPVRLRAPDPLLPRRRQPDAGCEPHRHGGVPREHRGHLRRHRVAGRLRRGPQAHRLPAERAAASPPSASRTAPASASSRSRRRAASA